MADAEPRDDLDTNLAEVAVALFASGTVADTLQQIVDLAEATVVGCDAAGVLVIQDGAPRTAASSGPLAATLDRIQIDAGEGPCVDASLRGTTFYAEDLLADVRWPEFGPAAIEAGVRCILAYSLAADRLGALNLYARLPAAFGVTDRAQAVLFTTLARLALVSAEERTSGAVETAHLLEALKTRELIGQAQGILMEREKITADQAFDVLRRASQDMNVKLRSVAERLVETGEAPGIRDAHPDR